MVQVLRFHPQRCRLDPGAYLVRPVRPEDRVQVSIRRRGDGPVEHLVEGKKPPTPPIKSYLIGQVLKCGCVSRWSRIGSVNCRSCVDQGQDAVVADLADVEVGIGQQRGLGVNQRYLVPGRRSTRKWRIVYLYGAWKDGGTILWPRLTLRSAKDDHVRDDVFLAGFGLVGDLDGDVGETGHYKRMRPWRSNIFPMIASDSIRSNSCAVNIETTPISYLDKAIRLRERSCSDCRRYHPASPPSRSRRPACCRSRRSWPRI